MSLSFSPLFSSSRYRPSKQFNHAVGNTHEIFLTRCRAPRKSRDTRNGQLGSTGMVSATASEKYSLLLEYGKHLKKVLRRHSGESVTCGGKIERQLRIYEKIKLLSKEDVDHIDKYFGKLQSKIFKLKGWDAGAGGVLENSGKVGQNPKNDGLNGINDVVEHDKQEEDDEQFEVTEVGPTPQLNGRVLTIFDIETSPNFGSPLKNRSDNHEEFKTPTSIRVKSKSSAAEYLGTSARKLTFGDEEEACVMKTPKSNRLMTVNETPRYLRTESLRIHNVDEIIIGDEWSDDEDELGDNTDTVSRSNNGPSLNLGLSVPGVNRDLNDDDDDDIPDLDDPNIEPSPLIKRTGRTLYDLHQDLASLKRNLTDLQEEEEATETAEEEVKKPISDSELDTVFDQHYRLRKKMKTMKRSTRRAKLKTDKIDRNDGLDDLDIHALAFGFERNEKLSTGNNESDNALEEEFTDDENYERKDIVELEKELNINKESTKSKGKHPLSNNFVRLKINRKGTGRFRRR